MSAGLDPVAGRDLVDRIGFLLVPGPPLSRGTAYLIIGLRARPTLDHFDPERIDYWVTAGGHGVPASIDWPTRIPDTGEFSWGLIRIVDRLGVSNEYVSFGGLLAVRRIEDVRVVVFASDAPIVARGGHSQSWESGSHEIAAFLARLRAAADPRAELEKRIADLSPVARYASFVAESLVIRQATEARAGWTRADRLILERERSRLRRDAPAAWREGSDFAADIEAA